MRHPSVETTIPAPSRTAGFTLVELCLVLVVLGLLVGGLLQLTRWQVAAAHVTRTRETLGQAIDALRGYAAYSGGRLPCPDSQAPFDGREDVDVASGECLSSSGEGWFPFATLGGAGREDAWNGRLRYRVLPELASMQPTRFPEPEIIICERPGAGRCVDPLAEQVLAVVLSHGPNRNLGLAQQHVQPGHEHERLNADGDVLFVMHEPRGAAGLGGSFDDIVAWLPNSLYQSAMLLH